MGHNESEKNDAQEQDQEQGDPGQPLMAGESGLRRLKLVTALILIRVIVGHGRSIY
jgi:hypothetical protein